MIDSVENTPPEPQGSRQYDLFRHFLGDERDLSNTIELWDAIPKYSVSASKQNQMRDPNGRLPVYMHEFVYHQSPKSDNEPIRCKLYIQPAAIKKAGKEDTDEEIYQDHYPSRDEFLIEEVLKKFFCDAQYGLHHVERSESWVRFTLRMIYKELKQRGRTRSIPEIRRSLEILARSIIEVEISGKGKKKLLYTNPILSDLTRVTRDEYLDDRSAQWCARLPTLVSRSVNHLTYRQFNYGVMWKLKGDLAMWLHRRLSHEYTNANIAVPYHILYSTIERDSGLLHNVRRSANIKAVIACLDELKEAGILLMYTLEYRKKGRRIEDIKFVLTPNGDFVRDVKAANARAKQGRDSAFAAGLQWDGRQALVERHQYGNEQKLRRLGDASKERLRLGSIQGTKD